MGDGADWLGPLGFALGAERWDAPETATRFELAQSGWSLRALCPLLPGGLTLIGDPTKYACAGDRRIARIRPVDGGGGFDVRGADRRQRRRRAADRGRRVGALTIRPAGPVECSEFSSPASSNRHAALVEWGASMAPLPLRDRPHEILIVHGDAALRAEIRRCLTEPNLHCREAASGAECLEQAGREAPDLVILDLYLPDQSGLGVCRLIRETPGLERVPIMVVTAQASEIDRVLAFESGADEFVPRPFYAPELRARVDAVLRGFGLRPQRERPARLSRGLMEIDTRGARASIDGERVDLTQKEFELLAELVTHAGRVVRRRQLIEQLWGIGAPQSDRAVDAHIKSIRREARRGAQLHRDGARRRLPLRRGAHPRKISSRRRDPELGCGPSSATRCLPPHGPLNGYERKLSGRSRCPYGERCAAAPTRSCASPCSISAARRSTCSSPTRARPAASSAWRGGG